jgi:hypothetical protein
MQYLLCVRSQRSRVLLRERESAVASARDDASQEQRVAIEKLEDEMNAETESELARLRSVLRFESESAASHARAALEATRAARLKQMETDIIAAKQLATDAVHREVELEMHDSLKQLEDAMLADRAKAENALRVSLRHMADYCTVPILITVTTCARKKDWRCRKRGTQAT